MNANVIFKLNQISYLIIVALTQYILFYRIIFNALEKGGISPWFDLFHISLLIITTLCITAGVYISNDIIDLEIDKTNKPDKVIIGNKLSIQVTYWFTGVVFLLGFLIAFYLALYAIKLPYLMLYPIAVGGLLSYNIWLKGVPFIGNLVVAIFTAGVAAIIWLAEEPQLSQLYETLPDVYHKAWQMLLWFMVFAFLSNLIRELVKDLEDTPGDKAAGLRTLPIAWGIPQTKGLALALLLILQGFIIYYSLSYFISYEQNILQILSGLLFLLFLAISILLYLAKQSSDYHRVSQLLKLVMVVGLILLFLFKI